MVSKIASEASGLPPDEPSKVYPSVTAVELPAVTRDPRCAMRLVESVGRALCVSEQQHGVHPLLRETVGDGQKQLSTETPLVAHASARRFCSTRRRNDAERQAVFFGVGRPCTRRADQWGRAFSSTTAAKMLRLRARRVGKRFIGQRTVRPTLCAACGHDLPVAELRSHPTRRCDHVHVAATTERC